MSEHSCAARWRERGLKDVDGDRDDLEEYRTKVLAEIESRADRVKSIDSQIAAIDFRLEGLSGSRRTFGGEPGRLLAQVALRAKVKRDRAKLEEQRAEAADDMRSARERLEQVDEELEERGETVKSAEGSGGERGD